MEPEKGLNKLEKLILPASAGVTFFQEDIQLIAAGDWNGVVDKEVSYLKTWHPPTVLGLRNMLGGSLGNGLFTSLVGYAVKEVGKIMSSDMVSRIGRDFEKAGHGVTIGGLADGLARPSKYNPSTHASKSGSNVGMVDPSAYPVTKKQASNVGLVPR